MARDFLFNLNIDGFDDKFLRENDSLNICDIKLKRTGISTNEVLTNELKLNLKVYKKQINLPQIIEDREILKHSFRYEFVEVSSKAKDLCNNKNFDQALDLLIKFKSKLSSSILKDEPYIKEIIEDVVKAEETCKPAVWQKTGTRVFARSQFVHLRQQSDVYVKEKSIFQNEMTEALINSKKK